MTRYACDHADCDRSFLSEELLAEHAAEVHTYRELDELLREELRDTFGAESNPQMGQMGVWIWIKDFTDTWVVFSAEMGGESAIFQVDYTIDANDKVTFGDPVEVEEVTTYVPVPPDPEDDPLGMKASFPDMLDAKKKAKMKKLGKKYQAKGGGGTPENMPMMASELSAALKANKKKKC